MKFQVLEGLKMDRHFSTRAVKWIIVPAFLIALFFQNSAFSETVGANSSLRDVPKGHWAEAPVKSLVGNGTILGYPDGTFKGNSVINRNEMAVVLDRVVDGVSGDTEKLTDRKVLTPFANTVQCLENETADLMIRSSVLEREIALARNDISAEGLRNDLNAVENSKISLSGDLRMRFQRRVNSVDTLDSNNWSNQARLGLNLDARFDEKIRARIRFMRDEISLSRLGDGNSGNLVMDEAYVEIKDLFGKGNLTLGRHWMTLGKNLVLADKMDGITFTTKMDKVDFSFMAFSTNTRNSGINDRHYGNDSGSRRYFFSSDNASFVTGGGAASLATGAGITGTVAPGVAPAVGDAVTLFTSPWSYSNPSTWYTGSTTASLPDWKYNSHPGLSLGGGYDDNGDGIGDSLAPVRVPVTAPAGVRGAFIPYAYLAPTGVLDTAGTDGQGAAVLNSALTRDWSIQSPSGLDSWAVKLGTKFGSHKVSAYYLKRKFDRYDPYTMLGDPWAAMSDTNNDGVVDVGLDGKDLSPAADPSYFGISLDGNVVKNLDYFFDFVTFDPDINNIGVDPVTGDALNAAGQWKGNNLSNGDAWVLGLNWSMTRDLSLLVQYGVGDEEFVPASIYESKRLNSMMGRINSPDPWNGSTFNSTEGMMSLTGVRDLIVSFKAQINEKTNAYVTLEASRDRDSSAERIVSGDPAVTGHPAQDFNLITVEVKHKYTPNVLLRLQYEDFSYRDKSIADATSIGNLEANSADDSNWGDWNRIRADVEVKF
ncbi:MAG: hypothetical protein CVV64_14835 [Candidatus Wallbacteria bacterium HGW-Wallbacteria-1]|jgi:hypothetical protein|uniref:SLH domain-containing protein n=1 Tax=Candidatus Wallbacteria bacterium HGW-Wallbacteria-1 TaxID=2013854 RepID=A0A2N1PLW2_9BACT|nr:MAG: hypothetical protein CVV64_14835 [Candidatus Wallbacteria bacterium HGW-Wallbacteria-1]